MCLQPSFPGKWSIDEAYLLYVGLMFGELGNYTVIFIITDVLSNRKLLKCSWTI